MTVESRRLDLYKNMFALMLHNPPNIQKHAYSDIHYEDNVYTISVGFDRDVLQPICKVHKFGQYFKFESLVGGVDAYFERIGKSKDFVLTEFGRQTMLVSHWRDRTNNRNTRRVDVMLEKTIEEDPLDEEIEIVDDEESSLIANSESNDGDDKEDSELNSSMESIKISPQQNMDEKNTPHIQNQITLKTNDLQNIDILQKFNYSSLNNFKNIGNGKKNSESNRKDYKSSMEFQNIENPRLFTKHMEKKHLSPFNQIFEDIRNGVTLEDYKKNKKLIQFNHAFEEIKTIQPINNYQENITFHAFNQISNDIKKNKQTNQFDHAFKDIKSKEPITSHQENKQHSTTYKDTFQNDFFKTSEWDEYENETSSEFAEKDYVVDTPPFFGFISETFLSRKSYKINDFEDILFINQHRKSVNRIIFNDEYINMFTNPCPLCIKYDLPDERFFRMAQHAETPFSDISITMEGLNLSRSIFESTERAKYQKIDDMVLAHQYKEDLCNKHYIKSYVHVFRQFVNRDRISQNININFSPSSDLIDEKFKNDSKNKTIVDIQNEKGKKNKSDVKHRQSTEYISEKIPSKKDLKQSRPVLTDEKNITSKKFQAHDSKSAVESETFPFPKNCDNPLRSENKEINLSSLQNLPITQLVDVLRSIPIRQKVQKFSDRLYTRFTTTLPIWHEEAGCHVLDFQSRCEKASSHNFVLRDEKFPDIGVVRLGKLKKGWACDFRFPMSIVRAACIGISMIEI